MNGCKARFLTRSVLTTLVLLGIAAPAFAADDGRGADAFGGPDQFGGYATTHILVKLADGVEPRDLTGATPSVDGGAIDALLAAWSITRIEPLYSTGFANPELAQKLGMSRTYRFHAPAGSDTPTMATAFSKAPGVERAEVDGIGGIAETVPNDPSFAQQWALRDLTPPTADIRATFGWDIFRGSSDVTIAIVDSGVQANHPELSGKVTAGWNYWDNNEDTDDPHGHGTHVSGIAAAWTNNGVGIAGVNWNARLLAIRVVSPTGSGTESHAAQGITFAANHAAPQIINMSLQYYTGTQTLRDAVDYAFGLGKTLIAAAGNGRGRTVAFPGAFPNCMAVTGMDRDGLLGTYSNYGPEVDVTAPGTQVYSLWRLSGYNTIDGTSMATPHVSGLAALLLAYQPTLTNTQIPIILRNTTTDMGDPGWDEMFGTGRINVEAALQSIRRGDVNCDGQIDAFDIDPFVLALSDPAAYAIAYPECDIERANLNGDGMVNVFDIDPFVAQLAGP